MQLGKGVKESAAQKLASKISSELANGESVLLIAKCNNFKPMIDRVVVTDQRVLALSVGDAKVKVALNRDDVIAAASETGWAGTIASISLAVGDPITLKGMEPDDAEAVCALLRRVDSGPKILPPAYDESAATPAAEPAQRPGVMARAKQALAEAQAAHQELERHNAATYGRIVKKGTFGPHTVEIYETGYVRVGMFLTLKSPFEKLASISFTTQIQNKSTGGRAVAAVATVGLSSLTSNEKRVLFLTLATDRKVHTLQTEGTMGRSEDKLGLGLEAAGRAVLADLAASADQAPSAPPAPAESASLAGQLTQLAELHRSGVLSDAEFSAAKARLLTNT